MTLKNGEQYLLKTVDALGHKEPMSEWIVVTAKVADNKIDLIGEDGTFYNEWLDYSELIVSISELI